MMGKASVPCPCNILARRTVLERVGGFEDGASNLYEDQVLYAKMILAAPVFVAHDCWARYRQHPESSCAVGERTGESDIARVTYLNWLARYLTAQGVQDAEVWAALRYELWACRHPVLWSLHQRAQRALQRVSGTSSQLPQHTA